MKRIIAPVLHALWVTALLLGAAQSNPSLAQNPTPTPQAAPPPSQWLVITQVFGGNANEYVTLTMRDSFAEIDKGPIPVQVLGPEGAQKLFEKLPAGTVTHIERSIARFVPELSIMPAEMPK